MPHKIVIGDDDELLLYSYVHILKKAGFTVFAATDGEKLMDCINEENPDMVISDIIMPINHGLDIVKNIRMNQKLKKIPVILISSMVKSEIYKKQAHQAGADEFLEKPINTEKLLACVKKYLS